MTHPRYNTSENLVGTMFEFGRYTLSYQPPEGAVEADVKMSICSSADLSEMLGFFESFLQAAGYVLDDRHLSLERKAPEFDFSDVPFTFGDTLLGNSGSDTISFGAANFAGMWGGMGNDVIKF
jgi:hypothetical protein